MKANQIMKIVVFPVYHNHPYYSTGHLVQSNAFIFIAAQNYYLMQKMAFQYIIKITVIIHTNKLINFSSSSFTRDC